MAFKGGDEDLRRPLALQVPHLVTPHLVPGRRDGPLGGLHALWNLCVVCILYLDSKTFLGKPDGTRVSDTCIHFPIACKTTSHQGPSVKPSSVHGWFPPPAKKQLTVPAMKKNAPSGDLIFMEDMNSATK